MGSKAGEGDDATGGSGTTGGSGVTVGGGSEMIVGGGSEEETEVWGWRVLEEEAFGAGVPPQDLQLNSNPHCGEDPKAHQSDEPISGYSLEEALPKSGQTSIELYGT
ncbi:hypothetical protein Rs2_28896 [Raphanus sativus]|nr:hypothetical protein Rs2_28896 [Raphanus sativus]